MALDYYLHGFSASIFNVLSFSFITTHTTFDLSRYVAILYNSS